MADNKTVDNGGLTDIGVATDEVSYSGDTVDVQLIKLVHVAGSEGSKTVLPVVQVEDGGHTSGDVGVMALGVRNDANANLSGSDLDYTPFSTDAKGNANVIDRRDKIRIAVASGGLTTATTAYVAGDQVGTQFTLANAARASGGTGTIVGVVLSSVADIIGAYDVVFFRGSVTLASDNAAFALSTASHINQIVGIAQLAGGFDLGSQRIAQAYNLAIPYDCDSGTSLYAALITRAGHTFFAAVTDLQLAVFVERD